MRLHDLTIAEYAATDAQWLSELRQAMTAWQNGRKAAATGSV